MTTALFTFYTLIGLIIFAVPFFVVDFVKLTTLNKLFMIVIMLVISILWPIIAAFLLYINADQLTKKNFELVVAKIKEMFGKQ